MLAVAGRSTIPRGTWPVLALWALFMPAAILHAPGSYAAQLVTYLYTLTILSALGPLFLMRSEVRQKLWVIMQIILAAALAGGALLSSHPQLAADGPARVYLTGSNTINVRGHGGPGGPVLLYLRPDEAAQAWPDARARRRSGCHDVCDRIAGPGSGCRGGAGRSSNFCPSVRCLPDCPYYRDNLGSVLEFGISYAAILREVRAGSPRPCWQAAIRTPRRRSGCRCGVKPGTSSRATSGASAGAA